MSDPGSQEPPENLGAKKTVKHQIDITGPSTDSTRLTGPGEDVEIVPGYLLIDKLGEGGMGVVYKAMQKSLNRVVALKMMRSFDDESFVARFRREAIAGAKINHPNIVAVYDHGAAHGAVYLVMEFVEGRNCADLVRSQGRVAPDTAFQIIKGSVLGLGHAFEQGVIHRDIKPANIMLDESGASDPFGLAQVVVKIGDFGLARLRDGGGESADLTQTGSVMGTPGYMAPEQSLGREVDFRADVYSLGVTSYYLLTGKRPFAGQTAMDIFHQKMSGSAVNPRDFVPDLAEGTVRVVSRMMARDPGDRYQSYAELLEDVDHVLEGREPSTGDVPPASQSIAEPSEVSRRQKRRRKTTKAGSGKLVRAGLLALVLVAVGVSAAVIATRDRGGDAGDHENAGGGAAPLQEPWKGQSDDEFLASLSDHKAAVAGDEQLRRVFYARAERVLEKRRLETVDALAGLHARGEYGRLATAVGEATEPYQLLGLAIPEGVIRHRQIAEAALKDGAGREERRIFEATGKETDPRVIVKSLEGFEDRFPFSPDLDEVRSRRAQAKQRVAREDVAALVERAAASWKAGRYDDVDDAVKKCAALCRSASVEEPRELSRYRDIAAQAMSANRGSDERDVWRRASAADADAETVAELLTGFADRFPFSPELDEAARLLADAKSKTTRLEVNVKPSTAQVYVDRLRASSGDLARRYMRGDHVVEVRADGHHSERRTVSLDGDSLTLDVRLGPKPQHELARTGSYNRPLLRSLEPWQLKGYEYKAAEAALVGRSSTVEWNVGHRTLAAALSHTIMKGASGWDIVLFLDRAKGDAEVRLLAGEDGRQAVFGLGDGELYVGERFGDRLVKWVQREWTKSGKQYFRLAWHGDVLAVNEGIRADGGYVGSMTPGWLPAADPGLDIAVRNGTCAFGEIELYPLD